MNPMMSSIKQQDQDKAFFGAPLQAALAGINADTQALWGSFTPQEMIEHLIDTTQKSVMKTWDPAREAKPEQKAFKQFFYSEKPFGKNMANPLFKEGKPLLIQPDLESAKKVLQQAIEALIQTCEAAPETEYFHIFAGNMSYGDLLRFHVKHYMHHLQQFGAL